LYEVLVVAFAGHDITTIGCKALLDSPGTKETIAVWYLRIRLKSRVAVSIAGGYTVLRSAGELLRGS
jgi:hypothetical protein